MIDHYHLQCEFKQLPITICFEADDARGLIKKYKTNHGINLHKTRLSILNMNQFQMDADEFVT